MKTRALITGIAALFLATRAAHATEDFCVEVTKTADGFLALREGPGTEFKMIAKLKPGYPLDADTSSAASGCSVSDKRCMKKDRRWTRVWIAERRSAWVYSKYIKPRDCPED